MIERESFWVIFFAVLLTAAAVSVKTLVYLFAAVGIAVLAIFLGMCAICYLAAFKLDI